MENIFPFIFFGVVITMIVYIGALKGFSRRRKFATMTVVNPSVEYPNNHHVLGVGYYHAASQKWFPYPWNEYREGRGYYWNGDWNATPDQRMVLKSTPPDSELERVNREWRNADPDRAQQFWQAVEHEGFGTAIRRREGG